MQSQPIEISSLIDALRRVADPLDHTKALPGVTPEAIDAVWAELRSDVGRILFGRWLVSVGLA